MFLFAPCEVTHRARTLPSITSTCTFRRPSTKGEKAQHRQTRAPSSCWSTAYGILTSWSEFCFCLMGQPGTCSRMINSLEVRNWALPPQYIPLVSYFCLSLQFMSVLRHSPDCSIPFRLLVTESYFLNLSFLNCNGKVWGMCC